MHIQSPISVSTEKEGENNTLLSSITSFSFTLVFSLPVQSVTYMVLPLLCAFPSHIKLPYLGIFISALIPVPSSFAALFPHHQAHAKHKLCWDLPYKYWSNTLRRTGWGVITWFSEAVVTFRMKNGVLQGASFSQHFNGTNCRLR